MPLTKLLKKNAKFDWDYECEQAFNQLRRALVTSPILVPPDWEKEFHVQVDASAYAIGSVLCQADSKGFDHTICYASRQLIAAERKYSTTEREALGMVFSV